jgi:hypothetical protein
MQNERKTADAEAKKEKRRSSVPNDTGEGSALAASAVPAYLLSGNIDDLLVEVKDCCNKPGGFKR